MREVAGYQPETSPGRGRDRGGATSRPRSPALVGETRLPDQMAFMLFAGMKWGQARAPTAERISSAIASGCETMIEWDASTSIVVAPIRLA